MRELPHCDNLFLRFFDPWHDDVSRQSRGFKTTFPDILQHKSFIGLSQEKASCIKEEMQHDVMQQIDRMADAARDDWPLFLSNTKDIDLNWIDGFDRHFNRDRIHEVIERSDPSDFSNDYIVICCEFGAALSYVLRNTLPRLIWRLNWPYWDSTLLDPKTGTAISVFHWAIKKMSEYGVDDGFAAKVKACVQFMNEERKISENEGK
jgi:hypothetical protein